MEPPPTPKTYYHMSGKPHVPGDIICANRQEKLPPEFEEPLEASRPPTSLPRRDFVYTVRTRSLTGAGIVSTKYIYRVEPAGKDQRPQVQDLAWIGPMQLARLKQKYGHKYLEAGKFPEWTDELVKRCCNRSWSGAPADDDLVGEYLFPCVRVVEIISDQLVDPKSTKTGWPPPKSI